MFDMDNSILNIYNNYSKLLLFYFKNAIYTLKIIFKNQQRQFQFTRCLHKYTFSNLKMITS